MLNECRPAFLSLKIGRVKQRFLLHENFRDVIDELSDNEYLIVEAN